ncbi:MAG TPA: phosphate ABC transporter permease PstA [Pseudomonadales bacterium]|nr:phosphate ABC transporter permease PstA [Pseudomonadales bacterium]
MSSGGEQNRNTAVPADDDYHKRTREQVYNSLARRYRKEKLFRSLGMLSVVFGIVCVVVLFGDIGRKGIGAFWNTWIQLEVTLDASTLGITPESTPDAIQHANYDAVIKTALLSRFPDVTARADKKALYSLVSSGAGDNVRNLLKKHPELLGQKQVIWVLADDEVDTFFKHTRKLKLPETERSITDKQVAWVEQWIASGQMEKRFNQLFFEAGDSREPEQAGIRSALAGSALTLLVTLLLSFPVGVAAAVYLEEFAPKNRFTDFIEVNINNLAAVPSIIFGLLGLAVFIGFFHITRSVPLVGGLVLTFMTLPTIIISSRAAIKSVPPSIREAAFGIGASQMQVVSQHVIPLAMPGMLTGAIIGMARALGETAPLLMIGMVAFIVDIPHGITDPSTVLPVQIYLWADSSERAFVERTSAAIIVLLAFLLVMNGAAVWLRNKLERRW